jgi:hypothetical protein
MGKDNKKSDFLLDNRIVQRNIRDGRLERKDFDSYLASLPDLKERCEDIGDEIYRLKKPGLALTGEFTSNEQDEE